MVESNPSISHLSSGLPNLNNNQYILEGSKLFSKFNKKSKGDINFVFSSKLINNYDNLCSNFLFGFLIKSYSFTKYKKDKMFNLNLFRYWNQPHIGNFKSKYSRVKIDFISLE